MEILDGAGEPDRPPWRVQVRGRDEPAFRADRLSNGRRHAAPRYIAVDRDALRSLPFEDGPLSELLLSAFIARREALQQVQGVGLEIVGPRRRRRPRCGCSTSRGAIGCHSPGSTTAADAKPNVPLVRLPGGVELQAPSPGEVVPCARHRPRAGPPARRSTCWSSVRGPPASAPRSTTLGGPQHARDRQHRARRAGRLVPANRELPRISGRHQRNRAHQPRGHPGAEVRRPHGDAIPCDLARPATGATSYGWKTITKSAARAVLLATGAQYRRLPVDGLGDYEGISIFYAAGPQEALLCGAARVGVVGGGNSAGQAAVWLARGGALVTLLHRRADLHETMWDCLVRELERYGVAVRDSSQIAALHGDDG